MLNEQTPLPDGWIYVSLDDALATLESGARPKGGVKKILVGVPSIGAEHLDGKGGFNFKNIRFIPAEFYKRLNRGIIKPLDVLVVKDGATTGKTSIVTSDFPFKESNVNEHMFILRPINQLLEPQYLFRFLSSNQGNRQILEKFQGSAQGGINSQFVKNFPIPLPPINEQKRIIAKIEALFAESKTARDALGKIPTLLQNLRQSIVAEAFRGELTYQESNFQFAKDSYEEHYINQNDDLPSIPKQWRWVTIGQLLCEGKGGIRTGPFGTLLKKSDFRKEGVYLIGIQNLGKDEFVWKDMKLYQKQKLKTYLATNSNQTI